MFAHAKEREYAGVGHSEHPEATHGEGTPMNNGDSATNRRIEEPRSAKIVSDMGYSGPDCVAVVAPLTNLVLFRHWKPDGNAPLLGLPVVARRRRAA